MAIARAALSIKLPGMQSGTQLDRRTIARQRKVRKQRFTAALALAGMTQAAFAKDTGVNPGHLSKVLNGERDSDRLTEKVELFIAKYLPELEGSAA